MDTEEPGALDSILAAPPVAAAIADLDAHRSATVRRFWLLLVGGAALAAFLAVLLARADQQIAAIWVGAILFVGAAALALRTVGRARGAFKQAVIAEFAAQNGLEYRADGFDPPMFAAAAPLLFGAWLGQRGFWDLLSGQDAEGRPYWSYAFWVAHRATRRSDTYFSGRVCAFVPRAPLRGRMIAVSERALLAHGAPAGLERVPLAGEPAFAARFELFASDRDEAGRVLGQNARALLVELGLGGRVLLYADPEGVFVAVGGDDPLDPGNLLRPIDGKRRAANMVAGARRALDLLERLRQTIG